MISGRHINLSKLNTWWVWWQYVAKIYLLVLHVTCYYWSHYIEDSTYAYTLFILLNKLTIVSYILYHISYLWWSFLIVELIKVALKVPWNAISEHQYLKFFLGGILPDPPSITHNTKKKITKLHHKFKTVVSTWPLKSWWLRLCMPLPCI